MKRKEWTVFALLCLIVLAGFLPGVPSQAASRKVKAMKAYAAFLAKHPAEDVGTNYYDAGFGNVDTSGVNSYFLYDMDKNGVPELFTYTGVNFRHYIVRVYTWQSGKVVLCKFDNGQNAEFDNNSAANGSYGFYICKKKHIHNVYTGGMESSETVYKGAKGKLKQFLTYREVKISRPSTVIATKGGKNITEAKYRSFTKSCKVKKNTWYGNNKSTRKKLKKGKLKVLR